MLTWHIVNNILLPWVLFQKYSFDISHHSCLHVCPICRYPSHGSSAWPFFGRWPFPQFIVSLNWFANDALNSFSDSVAFSHMNLSSFSMTITTILWFLYDRKSSQIIKCFLVVTNVFYHHTLSEIPLSILYVCSW